MSNQTCTCTVEMKASCDLYMYFLQLVIMIALRTKVECTSYLESVTVLYLLHVSEHQMQCIIKSDLQTPIRNPLGG